MQEVLHEIFWGGEELKNIWHGNSFREQKIIRKGVGEISMQSPQELKWISPNLYISIYFWGLLVITSVLGSELHFAQITQNYATYANDAKLHKMTQLIMQITQLMQITQITQIRQLVQFTQITQITQFMQITQKRKLCKCIKYRFQLRKLRKSCVICVICVNCIILRNLHRMQFTTYVWITWDMLLILHLLIAK